MNLTPCDPDCHSQMLSSVPADHPNPGRSKEGPMASKPSFDAPSFVLPSWQPITAELVGTA